MFGKRGPAKTIISIDKKAIAGDINSHSHSQGDISAPDKNKSEISENYFSIKTVILNALIDAIDIVKLDRLDAVTAREELRDVANEIFSVKNIVLSMAEQEQMLDDICNDILGFGPLEPLLARDDIADIMINGPSQAFIEVNGRIEPVSLRF